VCAVVAFVGLIELGSRSEESGKEKDWNTWVENATQLEFPKFRLSFDRESSELIVYPPTCKRANNVVPFALCKGHTDYTRCFAVNTDGIVVVNSRATEFPEESITCTFATTGYNATKNQNVAWELDTLNAHLGPDRYANILWLSPRAAPGAWVLLKKGYITRLSNDAEVFEGSRNVPIWQKSSLYHSTVSKPGFYTINTVISSFKVEHYEQVDTYNGWMAVGGIGGFAFWMLVMHGIAMIFIGFILPNESKFLKPQSSNELERRPMI
jgi:hypothetical protein